VQAALRGQDAVLSAVGIRVRVGPLIAIVILCQVIARFTGLIGPAGWLVRIGVPLLALLVLYRRTTMLSEGTKNIVRAMERVGVKRFVCESSLGIGDSKGQLGLLYNYALIPILLRKHLCRQRGPGEAHQGEQAGLGHRATGGAYQSPANTRVPQWVRRRGQVHSGQNIPGRRGGLHVGTIDRRRLFEQNTWRFVLAIEGVFRWHSGRSSRRITLPRDSTFRKTAACTGRLSATRQ
jgi:hypothetical protein